MHQPDIVFIKCLVGVSRSLYANYRYTLLPINTQDHSHRCMTELAGFCLNWLVLMTLRVIINLPLGTEPYM